MASKRFAKQHTQQQLDRVPNDTRSAQEYLDDRYIQSWRIELINTCTVDENYRLVQELDAAETRQDKKAIIDRWVARFERQDELEYKLAEARQSLKNCQVDWGGPAIAVQELYWTNEVNRLKQELAELKGQ